MGEGANEVISHTAPTPCLHVPRFEATDTIHRARKRGCRGGLQTDEVSISGRDYGRTLPQDDGNDHAGTTAAGIPVHPTFLPTSGPQRSLGHGLGGRLREDARLNYVRSRGLVVRLLAGHVARDQVSQRFDDVGQILEGVRKVLAIRHAALAEAWIVRGDDVGKPCNSRTTGALGGPASR